MSIDSKNEEFFQRLQELADIEPHKREEDSADKEDDLNYAVYELLEDAEIESQGNKRTGYIKLILDINYFNHDKFTEKDVHNSLKFEKNIYEAYIKNEMDLTHIIEADEYEIVDYHVLREDDSIVLKIKYKTFGLYG